MDNGTVETYDEVGEARRKREALHKALGEGSKQLLTLSHSMQLRLLELWSYSQGTAKAAAVAIDLANSAGALYNTSIHAFLDDLGIEPNDVDWRVNLKKGTVEVGPKGSFPQPVAQGAPAAQPPPVRP